MIKQKGRAANAAEVKRELKMHSLNTRSARVRQAILALLADALRAWVNGTNLDAVEIRGMIDALLDDEFAAERHQAVSEIRLIDE